MLGFYWPPPADWSDLALGELRSGKFSRQHGVEGIFDEDGVQNLRAHLALKMWVPPAPVLKT